MTSILISELHNLKTAFAYTTEIPLMGFKGQYDQFLKVITDIMQHIGIGHDEDTYVAFLKLQELRQELITLFHIRKIQSVQINTKTEKGIFFWAIIQNLDKYLKDIINGIEKEKVNLMQYYSKENFTEIEKIIKHCANELNRIRSLLKEQYT